MLSKSHQNILLITQSLFNLPPEARATETGQGLLDGSLPDSSSRSAGRASRARSSIRGPQRRRASTRGRRAC